MVGWHILAPGNATQPTLLVKPEFRATEYVVSVTDLVHVWRESLDRKNIIKRALHEETSIDPSEGASQLQLLLDNIKAAVQGKSNTTRTLLPAPDDDNLTLELQAELPPPFATLLWRLNLKRQLGDILFHQLLLPAFERSLLAQTQVQDLLKQVQEKDLVISRLIDKLETTGTDLSNVFPGAHTVKGPKTTVREAIFRAVPALCAFDETRWARSAGSTQYSHSAELFERVFADMGDSELAASWQYPDHWWSKLSHRGRRVSASSSSPIEERRKLREQPSRSVDDKDDFQVQDHPKLQHRPIGVPDVQVKDSQPLVKPSSPERMSTTDDGEYNGMDLEGRNPSPLRQPMVAVRASPKPPADTGHKRIGMLGKKVVRTLERASLSPSPIPESFVHNTETRPSPPPAGKPHRKLGQIGGGHTSRSNARTRDDIMSTNLVPLSEHGLEGETSIETRKQTEAAGLETEEQKAERRRVELKHELAEKKKVPPKKKRKF